MTEVNPDRVNNEIEQWRKVISEMGNFTIANSDLMDLLDDKKWLVKASVDQKIYLSRQLALAYQLHQSQNPGE